MAADQSAERGVISVRPSSSKDTVRNAHPCVYADTTHCGTFTSSMLTSHRSSTRDCNDSGALNPSNVDRSASARTALFGQPIIGLAMARMLAGME